MSDARRAERPNPPRPRPPRVPKAPKAKPKGPAQSRLVNQHELRDVRARLRGTIYEGTTPEHGIGGDLYSPRQIVDFCLDLGDVMLSSGADVRSTEVAIVAVSTKWNLAPLELDITGTAITIQYAPLDGHPLVKTRVIYAEGSNLHRLSRVYQIVDDLLHDDRDMTEAVAGLVEVLRSPPRWPSWLTDLAMGLLGVSVTLQAGGTWQAAVGAFVVMLGIMASGRGLTTRGIPQFFVIGLQAAATAAVGTLGIWAGLLTAGGAAAMVAAVVVLVLPHPTIVTWAQDAISGFRSMAVGRALVIGLIVAGVVCGIPAGLAVTARFVDIEVDPTNITLQALPLWLSLISSFAAASANSIAQGSTARMIPATIGVALVGNLSLFALRQLGLPLMGATFVAATLLGALSTVAAARLRTAATVIAVPAFCGSLLPSLAVASSLLNFLAGNDGAEVDFVFSMLTTLAIGAGLVLGSLLATPGARRWLRRTKRVRVQSVHTDTTPISVIVPTVEPSAAAVPAGSAAAGAAASASAAASAAAAAAARAAAAPRDRTATVSDAREPSTSTAPLPVGTPPVERPRRADDGGARLPGVALSTPVPNVAPGSPPTSPLAPPSA